MEKPQIIAYSLAYIKAGNSVEGLIHELSEKEGGMFRRVERAVKRGMNLVEALKKASTLEKDELMKEFYSVLAASASGELANIEDRLSELLNFSLLQEREKLRKNVKRFMTLSSALIITTLSFAIIGALSAIVASVPLGPFGNLFAGADFLAIISLPMGIIVMLLIAFLGWWFTR